MNNENESQEKDIVDSEKATEASVGNEVKSQTTEQDNASPLTTYESVNADAPVVTPSVIEERLAKIRGAMTERGAGARPASDRAAAPAPAGETEGQEDKGERRPKKDGNRRPGGRGPRSRDEVEGDSKGKESKFEKKGRIVATPVMPMDRVPLPSLRNKSDDIEQELDELFQDKPLETLMDGVDNVAGQELLEEGTKVHAKVVTILKDMAVVELGGREQGLIPLKQFEEGQNPEIGSTIEAVVTRFNEEEGLYEISLPLAAAEVGDWSSLTPGMIVQARVVGVNKGGLDCEVGRLRAFLPVGQIDIFRVENTELYIGEQWKVVITEANPYRRNLVISRRSLIEQEREELREKLWAELEVGQVREGLVRKIIDVGAFVDIGGLDGFIPISAMSWGRIKHPNDVLKEGDRIKITVTKIDRDANRISLSYKDSAMDPWKDIEDRFQVGQKAVGHITNIMSFGAFVELMPGVEGLVHISEISYQRVGNVADVLNIGDNVEVIILGIDSEHRRMNLSIKQLMPKPKPETAKTEEGKSEGKPEEEEKAQEEKKPEAAPVKQRTPFRGELKGGVNSGQDEGNKFGITFH